MVPRLSSHFHIFLHCQGSLLVQSLLKNSKTLLWILKLKVAYVQNPKGIALSWTLTEMDPKCASLQSYHLYLSHENLNNRSASHWKKIGKIRALPLSMACSFSQVIIPKKYYIFIQWKDMCGSYIPFRDIQSITP